MEGREVKLPPGVMMIAVPKLVTVKEDAEVRDTSLGPARRIRMWAQGYETMTWREIWEAFTKLYPGKWAVQVYPPTDQLVDGRAIYHLFVCEQDPQGLNIR